MTGNTVPSAFGLAMQELDGIIDVAKRLYGEDWERPAGLGEWTVAELGAHVAEIAWRQAEAFHRYRLATAEAPGPAPIPPDPRDLPERLACSADHLRSAAAHGFDETPAVPLPFAPLPASIAAQVIAIEYGVHRYDLHRAVDDITPLRADVAQLILDQAPVYLLMIGQPAPDGAGYRLRSDTLDMAIVRTDDQWQLAHTRDAVCTITGSDEDLALFIMGRLPHDDARLDRSGPAAHGRFKTLFPGP